MFVGFERVANVCPGFKNGAVSEVVGVVLACNDNPAVSALRGALVYTMWRLCMEVTS